MKRDPGLCLCDWLMDTEGPELLAMVFRGRGAGGEEGRTLECHTNRRRCLKYVCVAYFTYITSLTLCTKL